MELPLEKITAELLKDVEKHKTPECLDVDTLGEYIEHTLPSEDWDRVEGHLRSCLYCLNQLVELREMLFLELNAEPLPPSLERKLLRLVARKKEGGVWTTFVDRLKEYALLVQVTLRDILNSKYTWQTVSAVLLLAVLVEYSGLTQRKPEDMATKVAATVADSIVTVRGLDSSGATVRQGAGVIVEPRGVEPRGFILLPLRLVTQIASAEVTLTSGVTFPIKKWAWAGPERDWAVVELDTSTPLKLKALKIADPGTMQAGDRVVALRKTDSVRPRIVEGVLSDIIPLNPTRASREAKPSRVAGQFIPVGATDGGISEAILVNLKGEVISANTVSPEGEKVGLAMPIDNIESIINSHQTPIPLGELKYKSRPLEAVFYYVKGILAYNSGNIDEAINYQQKCLKIDDSFDRAHEELGGLYFLKNNYEKERFHYKEAIKLNPKNADAHFYLAQSYEDNREYNLAVQEFELVLTIRPSDEEARSNLGIDYLIIGRRDKALEQYEALKKIHESAADKLKRIIDLALPPQKQPAV